MTWKTLKTAEDKAAEQLAIENEATKAEASRVLSESDWYITRLAETGKAVPKSVTKEREKARETLSKLAAK